MGWEYTQEEYDTWQLAERGGAQGDYRDGVSCRLNIVQKRKGSHTKTYMLYPIVCT